jgi:N-acetylmuramoyl-L-alanine amidase
MKITQDHWLDNAIRDVIRGGSAMAVRRFLVIHHTAGATGKSSVSSMRARGLAAHLVIERDGTIIQCRPFNKTCGHAGASSWTDPSTGHKFIGLNSCSIGIELANAGSDGSGADAFDWAKKQPGFFSSRAKHKHESVVREWEGYSAAQLEACAEASKAIIARYNLDSVCGHDDISPGRKTDPGPLFDWDSFRKKINFFV